ncbi:low affinity immunoglobulin gamma Fc region receptor III-like [Leuresthes tenuis]|uniref:low affinity immunoglobulin gamma Fc region receptor III-like n=1 Tax=Leuresthes tenuis TaxID=355514 RepID=UPI003B509A8F
MELASVCLITATLIISPDRLQFFQHDFLTLRCQVSGPSDSWTVMRNTSSASFQPCQSGWGLQHGLTCAVSRVYPNTDSGVYWCQSKEGQCSNVLNIRVSSGTVILESPALPVKEGDRVTLRCSHKERRARESLSDFDAIFRKDGVFVGEQAKGSLILPRVSKANEGFYKCEHPTKGESPQSWLAVTVNTDPINPPSPPLFPLTRVVCLVLLFFLYTIILIVCVYKYRKWARARADAKSRDRPCLRPEC